MFFSFNETNNKQLSPLTIDLLLAYGAAYKKVARHEVIFREGQTALFFYLIETGRVKMCNQNDEGKEFIQGIFKNGETFGEPPLFADQPYPADAVALEDCLLLRIARDRFYQLLKENESVHFYFTHLLASRLVSKAQNMRDLSCYSPENRITNLLKQYKLHCCGDAAVLFRVDLTRQEIADMTGLRVETVIRTMKSMEEKGLLQIEHHKVLI